MAGFVQTVSDLKLIVSTDRRVWAAAAFVVIVFFTWGVTGAWREDEEMSPPKTVRIKRVEEKPDEMVKEFNKKMREAKEERDLLWSYTNRLTNQLDEEKEEIEWNVNLLVSKLNDMTVKVDELITKVGTPQIRKAEFEAKLKRQKKQRKKKKRVDSAEL